MTAFAHLHVHSLYSPMSGVASLEALCTAAQAQQVTHLALTDTNGLYGAVRFLEVARQAHLKPILGAELTHEQHRAVLLVKTLEGYANLCRLLSARHCDADFNLVSAVSHCRSGLIVLSDDLQALAAWKRESSQDLYVELTPGAMMHEALAYARRAHLPPVATTRAHLLHSDEWEQHRLLRAIALNTTLSRLPESACCGPTHWLMPPAVLARHFPHVPHALTNTVRIAEQCYTDWDFSETIFPAFRSFTDDRAFAVLKEKTYQGAGWRYGKIPPEVQARIEHELAVIQAKRYAHYFLVVEEIVREAPWTCGRGSAAASIVSYCLGVTHVDPIQHHLFFERFLNPGRQDPPDIDIDFPWDERDRILDKVFARYGTHNAAMVANQNMLGLRAALREVAKVYGMPPDELTRLTNRIVREVAYVEYQEQPTPTRWVERLTRTLQLRAPWPEIVTRALQIEGHFRHLSVHCGGVVIVPDEIRRYAPVEIAAKGVPVIQWEKDQTEEAGLVKIDLLGNRSLAVIRDALAAIAKNTGHRIEYAQWDPLGDPRTQDLIRHGDTMGCFYVESPATRLLLKKLWTSMPADRRARADVFEYLVIVSSLIRPAANRFVRDFVKRAHGHAYVSPHPLLDEVLAETFGIMVYQEDVTKVAMALAGFSVVDADQLRKVLSKKHKERQLLDYRAQFYRGAADHGALCQAIDVIWAQVMSFAGYSFCKPHSASYAQVSFKSAYLRAHHPAEFMAAVISNQGGFYSTFAYLSECRRMGLTVLPPDINASDWAYTGHAGAVRVGLMQLKQLSTDFAAKLIADRQTHGPYASFRDLLERLNPDPAQARILVKAGCCDSIAGELTRPALLWRLKAHLASSASAYLPIPPEYPESRRLQDEVEIFGFPLSRHPLGSYRDVLAQVRAISATEMAQHVGGRVTMVGVLITSKGVQTKDGEPMEFVSFEDETGLYDATLFPEIYCRVYHALALNHLYVLTGVIEEEFGALTLTVATLESIAQTPLDPVQIHEAECTF